MRPLSFSLLLTLLLLSPVAIAQEAPADPASADDEEVVVEWPRTGDAWLDTWLVDLERYAERYADAFVDELVRYRGAPRALVEQMMGDPDWRPADLYVACAVAQALGRTCREIAADWRRDPTEGWAAAVERLDAERHREALARVKRGLVESYDRWARPIRLDAALRRAFPDRGG